VGPCSAKRDVTQEKPEEDPMKIGRILTETPDGSQPRLVLVHTEARGVLDLSAAYRRRLQADGATERMARGLARSLFPGSLTDALGLGGAFRDALAQVQATYGEDELIDWETVTWLPPVDPPTLRDFNAFKNHDSSGPDVWFRVPLYFKMNPTTILGQGDIVPWPSGCEHMDYELELGLVVGSAARDLTPDAALDALFGVTVFNDFSVRNLLREELDGRLGPAKGKDFATAIGPWVVTCDELDLRNLQMTASVNGVPWSSGNSGSIVWSIEEILSYASLSEPLVPGEVLGTGTLAGGSGWELGRHLDPGDLVELTVVGIGSLRNTIGEPTGPSWTPRARPRSESVS
jgi:2-keto-4-pentenoate hydratase/2-oxohepta-3-ene-1,7-dioic acid hydratase in catechol pathway